VLLWAVWTTAPAEAQPPAAPTPELGLLPLIPAEAVFFIEWRGHEAVKEAAAASNLGKMAADEGIKQFVQDSLTKIGSLTAKEVFSLRRGDTAQIERHQKLLRQVAEPLWSRPWAAFAMYDKDRPRVGFLCPTGRYSKSMREAVEALMTAVAENSEYRRLVTYRSGLLTWHVLVNTSPTTNIPMDPVKMNEFLARRTAFMVAWHSQLLCAASDLRTAKAISKLVSAPAPSIIMHPGVRAVLANTAMSDWAFRWHVDMAGICARQPTGQLGELTLMVMELDRVRGLGGTEGYADGVWARQTYLDAPKVGPGLFRLFTRDGAYQRALAMTPQGVSFALGGQLDTKKVLTLIREVMVAEHPAARNPKLGLKPGLGPKAEKVLELLGDVAEVTDGDAAIYVNEPRALLPGRGTAAIGVVLSLTDVGKARKAIDELIALAEADDKKPPQPVKPYRGVTIRRVGRSPGVRIALLDDRMVLALSDSALKVAIEAALDDTGGLEPGCESAKLMAMAGEGAGFLTLGLAGLVQENWPVLIQAVEDNPDHSPLASVPSTQKMVRLLGPEVAVFERTGDGLRIKSRGKIPFAAKVGAFLIGRKVISALVFGKT